MIINTISNLHLYKNAYKGLDEVIAYLHKTNLDMLAAGRTDVSDTMYIVAMSSDQTGTFDGVLELHRKWVDIHCTLEGTDVVRFEEANAVTEAVTEFDEEKDYMLLKTHKDNRLDIPSGYFCIIDTSMAHMAVTGKGHLKKVVIKFRNTNE